MSRWKVNRIRDREKFGNRKELLVSSLGKGVVNSLTLPRRQSCSSGGLIQDRHTTAQLLMMDDDKVHPYNFKCRIIFMSIDNDIAWDQKHNEDVCKESSANVSAHAKCFRQDGGPSVVQKTKKKWYGLSYKPDVKWSNTAEVTVNIFAERGHLVFRC